MAKPVLIGVLGGMGPLATLDLLHKIIAATPAEKDQDHVPVVCWNVPQIADRQKALAGKGDSPLPQLLEGIEKLNRLDVSHIVIPCNTAHHWYHALVEVSHAPILHIADETITQILSMEAVPKKVGIIATQGTLSAGWYQKKLIAANIEVIFPTEGEMNRLFVAGCYAVKQNKLATAAQLLEELSASLVNRGAEKLLLACTEVPLALAYNNSPFLKKSIDPTEMLAQSCVNIWKDQKK
ncbi:aspartate/glutamate racemase family protein [Zymomonas mobilis]|uniref:Aspartate racemase n=1 Tax=Zymomonas mobilis subsp. mobilis (strain ATCC 31821 / ZM4 / CP4) TaxID=264203 RepID=A0A806CKL8_ZYMMO|nr:amino acid racemase [Zymomonas mobilis]ADC33856.1 aspartate racemase [Zymomonas mobilis subsp. mobilis ZM4 = ATCC 31821]AHB11081.1 aspartate racemase [Zymomonas mobilis subsp. mobilis str. CP4 = NRRL B-14023]AHJ71369.1 Aspartate racemase [Zymomonas mobilis subsp. mobilis NRRL B-12526]AHJ73201.1 Aspartate racemase [Zymomonas mobilis subsp. mobilis str. CP4 = NRRL B-14023]